MKDEIIHDRFLLYMWLKTHRPFLVSFRIFIKKSDVRWSVPSTVLRASSWLTQTAQVFFRTLSSTHELQSLGTVYLDQSNWRSSLPRTFGRSLHPCRYILCLFLVPYLLNYSFVCMKFEATKYLHIGHWYINQSARDGTATNTRKQRKYN